MPLPGYAYFASYSDPPIISKIRLLDFTLFSTLTLDPGDGPITAMVIDPVAGFIYVAAETSPGRLTRVRISDFTKNASLDLGPGEDFLQAACIDPTNKLGYFVCQTAPTKIVKVDLTTFTRISTLTLAPNRDNPTTSIIHASSGFLYLNSSRSFGSPQAHHFHKINLSSFTQDSELAFLSVESLERASCIDALGEYAYLGLMSPTQVFVVKINLLTMTEDSRVEVTPTTSNPKSMLMTQNKGSLLVGTLNAPARIAKAALSPFSLAGILPLNASENGAFAASYDPKEGFAYFGMATTPGTVVKIRVSDLTRVGAISAGASSDQLYASAIELKTAKISYLPILGIG